MSFQSLHSEFDEALAQFLWDQWYAIGGSGSAQKAPVDFIVDIEALILGTTRFGRSDPRILEQCIDWLALNGKLVNLQRLKNIQRHLEIGDEITLGEIAEFMLAEKYHNWKAIRKHFSGTTDGVAERPVRYQARKMARHPDCNFPECFQFKMRNFFGMTARAEVFTWLLTNGSGHAARIAKETFWQPKTVETVLSEMEQSRIVSSISESRRKIFRLVSKDWTFLTSEDRPINSFNEPAFFGACGTLITLISKLTEVQDSGPDLHSLFIRKEIGKLATAFVGLTPAHSFQLWERETRGEKAVSFFVKEIRTLVERVLNERLLYKSNTFPPANQVTAISGFES